MGLGGAAGCACGGGCDDEALAETLLDLEQGAAPAAEAPDEVKVEPVWKASQRIAKFGIRGSMILLWLYLFNSMRRYAVSYTGEDTWFATFAATVVAVPLAEIFCIFAQIASPPSLPMGSSTPCGTCGCTCATGAGAGAGGGEAEGPGGRATAPRAARTVEEFAASWAAMAAADGPADRLATARIARCIARGLMVLPWVFLVDLLRRFVTTRPDAELFVLLCPLLILAALGTVLFGFLMEVVGEWILIDFLKSK